MKLSESRAQTYTRALIFGLPGSGKSTLAAALSRTHKLYWFSLDNDADVLKKLPPEQQERIEFFDIPDSASFPVASQTLLQVFKAQKGKVCHVHGLFNCSLCNKSGAAFTVFDFTALSSSDIVVIDTGSQLGRSILAHVTKDESVDYKPERDDWGALRKYTEYFASQFQAFRGNLIIICHAIEHVTTNSKGEVISSKLIPDFGSKGMALTFGKSFSHVIFTEVKNKKHRAYSSSTASNDCLTKSRTDFKIEDLPEPDLSPIFPLTASTPQGESTQPTPTPASSPAQNAVTGLTKLQQQMREKGLMK
jgi:hypothetical protein